MLRLILVVLAVIFLIGMLPTWPYSTNWGYYPSGGLLLLVVLAFILLSGRRGELL